MNLRTALIASFLVLAACSNVKNDLLPPKIDQSSDDWKRIIDKLGDDDKRLLVGYVIRTEMSKAFGGKADPGVVTVGDAIEAQKKWADARTKEEAEAEALAAEQKAKIAEAAKLISQSITVGFVGAKLIPSDAMSGRYSDYLTFDLVIQNKGAKDITGIKGDSVWYNTFGEEYARVTTNIEEPFKAGTKNTWTAGKEVNQFSDDDKKLINLNNDYKYKFEPRMIVFADGATIGTPDAEK